MKQAQSVEVSISENKKIIIESGLLAGQAHGAVTVRQGDTVVFCAVTAAKEPREGMDYFPLQVEYREKFYAAGRFPGGFFKREARPSEKEVLTARFTDRPLRPLFPESYRNEVQVNCMLLSADGDTEADVLAIVAASAALALSEIPFRGPIAGVRVGRVDGQFVLNPTHTEMQKSDLDMVYAGLPGLPVMIEGSARELGEAAVVEAMRAADAACAKLIEAQLELRRKLGLPDKVLAAEPAGDAALAEAARKLGHDTLAAALAITGKQEREAAVDSARATLKTQLLAQFPDMAKPAFAQAFDVLERNIVRDLALNGARRLDGRGPDELRPLDVKVGLLPRVHGSALFSRGETQALCTVTLGTVSDTQGVDAITGGADEKKFMLHYNFPPYSTGEVGRLGSTGRREVGHGALAERSLEEVMPPDYPYTVRLVSEIMSSNGSSSMASVCAGCLALMDAGVPIRKQKLHLILSV